MHEEFSMSQGRVETESEPHNLFKQPLFLPSDSDLPASDLSPQDEDWDLHHRPAPGTANGTQLEPNSDGMEDDEQPEFFVDEDLASDEDDSEELESCSDHYHEATDEDSDDEESIEKPKQIRGQVSIICDRYMVQNLRYVTVTFKMTLFSRANIFRKNDMLE